MKTGRILTQSIAVLVAATSPVAAATFTWDANAATAPNPFDGGAAWTATNVFWSGTANVTWTGGTAVTDTAVFGAASTPTMLVGIPGNVTFTTAISAGGMVFNPYVGNAAKYNIQGGAGGSLTLNGAPTIAVNTDWVRPFAAINGIVAGTAGFDVTTTTGGILELGTQANTFSGTIRLQSGSSLSIGGADSALGATSNTLTFAGTSTLIGRSNVSLAAARGWVIANGSTAKFDVLNGATVTLSSGITETGGVGNLQKEGLGALQINRTHTYTGETRVRQGQLTLDFSIAASPTTDIVNSASRLRLFGGTLAANGKSGAVTAQTFSGLALDPGASSLTQSLNGATSLTLNLGAITRNPGSTLNVATIAAGTNYTTTTANTNGILRGYATVNGSDWLANDGAGNFTAFAAYNTNTDTALWGATDNVSVAVTPTVPLAGNATVNSLLFAGAADVAVPGGSTFDISSGGVLVRGGIGATGISGGKLRGSIAGDLIVHQHNTTAPLAISSVIENNGGATALTKSGAGLLTLSGANTYSGNTFLNAGTLEVSGDANLGTGSTVTARAGTTLLISGASAFASAKNFQFDLGSDSYGGAALGAAQGSLGNFNVNVTNTAGATISGAFNVSGGTFVKTGAGALTLTNPGVNHLSRINGGLAFTVEQGNITFDGGPTSEWHVGQGEFNIGIGDNGTAANTKSASVTLNSGTFRCGSFTALGRGTGNIGNTLTLNVNGGLWQTGNFFTGFANGVAGYNPTINVNVSNNGALHASGAIRFAESAGAFNVTTLSGTAQVLSNGIVENGFGGRALTKIATGTSFNATDIRIGAAANGAGAIWNRGSLTARSGASTNHFPLGNGVGAYGYYLHDTATPTTLQEVGVGGAGGGSGVLEIRTGTLTTAQWMTLNRTDGANATSAQLLIGGGTLVPNNLAGRFYANQVATAALTTYIDVGTGGRIAGGNVQDINLNNSAGASHQTTLAIHDGGVVETTRIFAAQATGVAVVNLNNGTLRATASANLLDNNLDGVVLYPGGGYLDTNGFNASTTTNALLAPVGNGIGSISLATNGAGYFGRPVVKITDTTGSGATAVANFDEGTGQLTGISITSPGSNYTAPTITLVGGGFSTAGTLGPIALSPNSNAGGLTKAGNGTLTLGSAASTFGGATTISGGVLSVGTIANGGVNSSIGASSSAVGNLVIDGGTLLYTGATVSSDRGFTIPSGKTGTISVSNGASVLTLSGGTAATTGALTKVGAGVLSLTGVAAYTGATTVNGGILGISGTLAGPVAVNSGGTVNAAYQAVGMISTPTLTLGAGSGMDFDFGAGNDVITISTPGGLTLGSTALNLYVAGGVSPFSTNGTYTLLDYDTSFSGSLGGAFSVTNSQPGKIYSIGNNAAATSIELTIGDALLASWNVDGGGSWNVAANWTGGIPNSLGAAATFGGVLTAPNAPATVTLDGSKTVGNIVFNNANTYTISGGAGDALTLNNGLGTAVISAVSGSHSVTVPVAYLGQGAVNADAGAALTVSGDISGAANLAKTGGGVVVLTGTNSHLTTTVNGGTLQIGDNGTTGTLGSGAVTIGTGATLNLRRSNAMTVANNISGAGNLAQTGSGETTYTGTATHTGATTVTGGTLINEGTINGTSSLSVNNGSAILRASSTTTVSGVVNVASDPGAGGILRVQGAANATFTGATNVATGGGSTGGYFMESTGTVTTPASINVGGAAAANGTMAVSAGTLAQSGGASIFIGNNGGTGTYTQSGGAVTAGTGHFQVGVGGGGTTGTATISGGTLLSNGEIWASNNVGNTGTINVTGSGAMTANSWIAVGRLGGTGTLDVSGGSVTKAGNNGTHIIVGSLAGSGTVTQTAGAVNVTQGDMRLGENNAATASVNNFWNMSGGSSTVQGSIQIGWRSSTGEWSVSGTANATAGRLTVGAETSNAAAGPAIGTVNVSGGTVNITGAGGESRIGGDIAGSTGAQGNLTVLDGTLTFGGNVQYGAYGIGQFIQAGGAVNVGGFSAVGRFTTGNASALILGGTYLQTNPGTGFIVGEEGIGALTVGGTGALDAQTLFVGHAATGNGTVILDGGTLSAKLIQKTSPASIAAFRFNGGVLKATANAADYFVGFPAASISVEAGGANVDTNGFAVTVSQGLAGGGGLTKLGNGTLTLSGASTYTGTTLVDEGTLRISGSLSGTSGVSVESGGILAGSGVITALTSTIAAGGKISPGAPVGTLTFNGGLDLSPGVASAASGALVFDLGAVAASDRVLLSSGTLTIGSGALNFDDFNFTSVIGFGDGTYTLFDTSSIISGSLGASVAGQIVGPDFVTYNASLSVSGDGQDVLLTVAVPEPGSAAFLLGGLAVLAGRRRRRNC